MKLQLALLRGINVVGKHTLPMKELVEIFESTGARNVRSYIQSGNVVFEHEKKWGATEASFASKLIADRKGFTPHILLLGKKEFLQAMQDNPFPTAVGKALHLFFLDAKPKQPNLERIQRLQAGSEEFLLTPRVFYLYTPEGFGPSRLASAVESALGVPATARNWNTVNKLAAMLGLPRL